MLPLNQKNTCSHDEGFEIEMPNPNIGAKIIANTILLVPCYTFRSPVHAQFALGFKCRIEFRPPDGGTPRIGHRPNKNVTFMNRIYHPKFASQKPKIL